LNQSNAKKLDLSVVVPVFNEEGNIPTLVERLYDALIPLGLSFEIIAIDDGSRDRSYELLAIEAARHPEFKVVGLRRNFGQTAALMAGLDVATGEILVLMDADLQNDPSDIPILIAKLSEGYDLVSGWRKDRKDASATRIIPSQIANWIISALTGVRLHDFGCTLKAYRRDALEGVRLYGEMHRFIPVYSHLRGARLAEIVVKHSPRTAGQSSYGLERVIKVLLDLIVLIYIEKYFVKPIYLFGGFGVAAFGLGGLAMLYMFFLKFVEGVSMILTPLPLLCALMFLVGSLSIFVGLLAETLTRTYFESQDRRTYAIRDTKNIN